LETAKTSALQLEVFGEVIEIAAAVQVPYLKFAFRPHIVEHGGAKPRFYVEFAAAPAQNNRDAAVGRAGTAAAQTQVPLAPAPETPTDIVVRSDNATLVSRSTFHGWGNVPPQMPPFASWPDRLAVLPGVVLTSGDTVVALIGSPYSAKVAVTAALARRGWRLVSGSLLVIDRAHGWVLPYHTPLEARGAAAAALRESRPPRGMYLPETSPVSGKVLQVRPEALGPIVPIRAKLPRPALVRLCQETDALVRLEPRAFHPSVWPADAYAEFGELPMYRLSVPGGSGAEEAAALIDERLPAEHTKMQEDECRVVPYTPTVLHAGSTESRPT
jgi:hypothetical protein